MNSRILLTSILFLVLGLTVGLGFSEEKLIVIATTAQLEDFAAGVGGDLVEVYPITPSGLCPAHYDVRPRDIDQVSRASLVLYHGVEPWLEDLIGASGNDDVERVQVGVAYTPPQAIERVGVISEALGRVDPANAEYFDQNAQDLQESIDETAAGLKEEAEQLQVDQTNVISMKWQAEFVGWLGFNVVETYGPEELLSMRDLVELAAVGKENNVALVIDNLQSGISFGARLAFEIGAVHVVLTNFPGAVPHTGTYLEMIRYNADRLFEALKIYYGEE